MVAAIDRLGFVRFGHVRPTRLIACHSDTTRHEIRSGRHDRRGDDHHHPVGAVLAARRCQVFSGSRIEIDGDLFRSDLQPLPVLPVTLEFPTFPGGDANIATTLMCSRVKEVILLL